MDESDPYWRLEEWGEHSVLPRGVVGLGATVTARGEAPLVLVDVPRRPGRLPYAAYDFDAAFRQYVEILQPLEVFEESVDVEGVHDRLRGEAQAPVVLSVSRPEPMSEPTVRPHMVRSHAGSGIRCAVTHTRGTISFPVSLDGGETPQGFLTAGHVVPGGPGSTVEMATSRRFRRKTFRPFGTVRNQEDPIGALGKGGWDFAVVATNRAAPPRPLKAGVASLPRALTQPLPVTLRGSISGVQPGGIVGSLTTLGADPYQDPSGNSRLWRDCWILIPSAIAQQGDSGAAIVESATGAAVGVLVGGSRMAPLTTYAVQYAQDVDHLSRHVLQPLGVSIV